MRSQKEDDIDSSSEGTLSRCCGEDGDDLMGGVDGGAMAIVQGYTPSGLATSSAAKGVGASSSGLTAEKLEDTTQTPERF